MQICRWRVPDLLSKLTFHMNKTFDAHTLYSFNTDAAALSVLWLRKIKTDFLICGIFKNSQQFDGFKVILTAHVQSSCKRPPRHLESSLTGGATVYVFLGSGAWGPRVEQAQHKCCPFIRKVGICNRKRSLTLVHIKPNLDPIGHFRIIFGLFFKWPLMLNFSKFSPWLLDKANKYRTDGCPASLDNWP